MKKAFTLTILSLFSMTLAFGQFTISPSPATITGDPGGLLKAIATITNTSGNMLTLQWEREIEDIPMGWQTAICDPDLCSAPFVATREFVMAPGQSGTMSTWFTPGGNEGFGETKVLVWVVGDSANTVQSNMYYASTTGATSVEELETQDWFIYPNPAVDLIYLPDHPSIRQVALYNAVGRQLRNFEMEVSTNRECYVGDLPKGIYLVQLLNKDQEILRTIKFAKH